jgi:integrase
MAVIVRTPAGTWKAVVRRKGWPTTSKSFRTRNDAEAWARRTEDEMVRGLFIQRAPSERMVFSVALRRYLAEVTPTKKPTTQVAEIKKSKPLDAYFGKYSLAAITPDLVAQYREFRLASDVQQKSQRPGVSPKKVSTSTVRLELALLSHLFTVAIQEWRIGLTMNPVANIRKPAPARARDRRLTAEERRRIFDAVNHHSNPMLAWIVRIAEETGMRKSEIVGLRRNDVDLQKRVAVLRNTKNGETRTVPLSHGAGEALAASLAHPMRPSDTDLIFFGEPGSDGLRRPYAFEKTWNEMKKKAGVRDFRFHDLRHESTSQFFEMGLSDQEVAAITGHKSMQMLKRYTHLRSEDLVARIDELSAKRMRRRRSVT